MREKCSVLKKVKENHYSLTDMKEYIVHYPWIQYISIARCFEEKSSSLFSNTVILTHMVISGPSLAFIGNWVCRGIIQLSVEKRRRRVIYLQWMELMNKNWLIVWHWERNIILKRGTGLQELFNKTSAERENEGTVLTLRRPSIFIHFSVFTALLVH